MLKEVQVPPALFLGIIGFYASMTTPRAGKGTSPGKIDPDVEAFFLRLNSASDTCQGGVKPRAI